MARASIYTITPLDTYARIMGINPIHFNGGDDHNIPLVPQAEGCRDIWHQHEWQSRTRVSREELAREIANSEQAIASELRYWPAPHYIENERGIYPGFFRPDYVGTTGASVNGSWKSLPLKRERFITGGRRAVTLVEADVAVSYPAPIADAFTTNPSISVATNLTELTELRVFFAGKGAAPEWEIRPLAAKAADGVNFTAEIKAEMLLDPTLQEAWPGDAYSGGIDVNSAGNFVTAVDVYRVYTDPEEQCTLYWSGRSSAIAAESQTAQLKARDPHLGLVSPVPSTYDSGQFTESYFTNGFEPDRIEASYLSGLAEIDDGQYVIPEVLAQAIVYMTTARLEKPMCSTCQNVSAKEQYYKQDLIIAQSRNSQGEEVKFIRRDILNCPFGTRQGEVEAWRTITDIKKDAAQYLFALL